MKLRRLTCTVAALTAVVGLAGCSGGGIDLDSLEDQVSTFYADNVGQEPDSVDCPDEIDAEEGATGTCTLTAEGVEYTVDVTVDNIDGDTANFSIVLQEPDAETETE